MGRTLPIGWVDENSTLIRIFTFANFVDAVNFVRKLVPLAEQAQHHPDIMIFSYKKVSLTTHDQGCRITNKDVLLARAINRIVRSGL